MWGATMRGVGLRCAVAQRSACTPCSITTRRNTTVALRLSMRSRSCLPGPSNASLTPTSILLFRAAAVSGTAPALASMPASTSQNKGIDSCSPNSNAQSSSPTSQDEEIRSTRETFCASVLARSVGNAQLRRFIQQTEAKDWMLAKAALDGAADGGLKPNAATYDALLHKLMDGGQLKLCMEIFSGLPQKHILPTPDSYVLLMEMCLGREMPSAVQKLFMEMQRRGVRPSPRNYELMIMSLAAENPPNWSKAIEVFDKISREKHGHVTANTYNALMTVYLNMQPFDWRVVYNCYHEMRNRQPPIPLQWDSYLILREALRRGKAGRVRRAMAFFDAWVAVTHLRSREFAFAAILYLFFMYAVKIVLGLLLQWYWKVMSPAESSAESILPP